MSGTLKCEKCGAVVHADRIHIVKGELFCDICYEQYQKEKAARPKIGKICVIDDDGGTRFYFEQFLEDFDITHLWRIPEDESTLAEFDVVIVDGQGIGNSKYKNGKNFLMSYRLRGMNRGCIYHSGFISGEEEKELNALKIECVEKGHDPDIIVQVVKGFFK